MPDGQQNLPDRPLTDLKSLAVDDQAAHALIDVLARLIARHHARSAVPQAHPKDTTNQENHDEK